MEKVSPKISIIVPVYNTDKYLCKCLDSLINQTFQNIEIICINDFSSDNSLEVLKSYELKDERIKIIELQKRSGAAEARNSGIEEAFGEYICFVDSDDWIDINYLENFIKYVIKYKIDVFINTNIICEYTDKSEQYIWKTYPQAPLNGEFLSNKESIGITPWVGCAHIYRKDFLDEHNLRFPKGFVQEDYYFKYITEIWTDKIFAIHGSGYHYRQRAGSVMSNITNKIKSDFEITGLIMDYYELHNLELENIYTPNIVQYYNSPIKEENTYELCKAWAKRLLKYIKAVNAEDKFNKFCLELVLNTKNFDDYILKTKTDLKLLYLRQRIGKMNNE